jgi:hypothetical protein
MSSNQNSLPGSNGQPHLVTLLDEYRHRAAHVALAHAMADLGLGDWDALPPAQKAQLVTQEVQRRHDRERGLCSDLDGMVAQRADLLRRLMLLDKMPVDVSKFGSGDPASMRLTRELEMLNRVILVRRRALGLEVV